MDTPGKQAGRVNKLFKIKKKTVTLAGIWMYYYKLNINTYLYPLCTNQTQWGGVGTRDICEVRNRDVKMFYYIFYKLHTVIPAFGVFSNC